MKFLARGHSAFKERRYLKQAALGYLCCKLLGMVFMFYLVDCAACQDTRFFIIRGLIHAVLFSHFIFIGLLMAIRMLAWISFFRVFVFLTAVFINRQVIFAPLSYEVMHHSPYGGWVFLVPALLQGMIAFLLIRALVLGRERKVVSRAKAQEDKPCPFQTYKNLKRKFQIVRR